MSAELSQIAHLFLSTADSSAEPFTVRALLASHLADAGPVTRRIAQHFTRQLGSVGLLEFDKRQTVLRLFTTMDTPLQPRHRKPPQGDLEDISAALADLPGSTDLLLVALESAAGALLDKCQQISVVASPEPTAMVAAYRQLKRLRSPRPEALGLTLVGCSSVAQGQRIAERFRQTALEFLGLPLRLDAIVLRSSRLRERNLAQVRSVDERILAEKVGSLCKAGR